MWYIYLLHCSDGTLYCGITNNLSTRVDTHNRGKGAKYTRGRGPVELVWSQVCQDKGEALRLEVMVKELPRTSKLLLVNFGATVAVHNGRQYVDTQEAVQVRSRSSSSSTRRSLSKGPRPLLARGGRSSGA